jgi:hypothetical protein
LRLWVMYSSTLISCIWKRTQTFVKNHIKKPLYLQKTSDGWLSHWYALRLSRTCQEV